MADVAKVTEEKNPLQGFDVVDSVSNEAVGQVAPEKTKEITVKNETARENGEVTTTVKHHHTEEHFSVIDEKKDDVGKQIKLEDEVIVLDDAEDKTEVKAPDLNQSTLIITTEDLSSLDDTLYDTPTKTKEIEVVKVEKKKLPEEDAVPKEPMRKPAELRTKDEHSYLWVANITRQVKAADLKKFFGEIGKVVTAKILTNGKNYFGYVSMSSSDSASMCIRQLNNTMFAGRKIALTKDRPDLKEVKAAVKIQPKKKSVEKDEVKKKESKREKTPEKSSEEHSKCAGLIADLKRKLDGARSEASRNKYKLMDLERKHEGMKKKCETLERDLKEEQYKTRAERRRLNQDREEFEKTKKVEQLRFDADRAVINKELDEVKRLREHLKEKIEEVKIQARKAAKKRSRSPPCRSPPPRSRARSPPLRNSNSSNVFRLDEREEKKRKRVEVPRGRTPPPPPKLAVPKKRSDRGPENNAPARGYYGQKSPPAIPRTYDYRHKNYGLPQEAVRGCWPVPFPKDPRRIGSGSSAGQSYAPATGGGYPYPPSTVSVPQRSYYPEFGKPYGPY
ncbi:hypothetical protein NQ317_009099 [Molorchus minor]|uniref:RRM domain-containing protein n=1 Tax=Molorchus minor TaxID=1323400 RepID=A0ABQ9J9C1_9CUCU|nr:hypothetical protein NQ317_009099 [Molorchus minor]